MKRVLLTAAFLVASPAVHAQTALEWAAQGMGGNARLIQPLRPVARERRARNCVASAFSLPTGVMRAESVLTSWYGGGEKLNRHTANGEVFRPNGHGWSADNSTCGPAYLDLIGVIA